MRVLTFCLVLLLAGWSVHGQPIVSGGGGGSSSLTSPSQIHIVCQDSEILKYNSSTGAWACAADASSEGSGATLDTGDDGDNESTSILEIATTGDTNSIFTEPSADKLLISLTANWPTADTAVALDANANNCSAGQAPTGVDASGAAEACFDVATQSELNTVSSALTTHESDTTAVHGLNIASPSSAQILIYDGTTDNRFENVAVSGDVTITEGGVTAVADNSHNHQVGNISNVNAGSDLTADLEEETHASEHAQDAADEIFIEDLGTTCTEDQLIVADASGGLVCGESSNPITGGATITVDSDCSTFIDIGEICIDAEDGTVTSGDSQEAASLGGSSGGGETLDETFDLGKTIDGADSEENAFVIGDGSDGFRIFVDTGGPRIDCFIGEGTCDIINNIPSGNSYKLQYSGNDGITIDSSGNVTLSGALIERKSMWFGAGTLSTDGTNCTDPAEKTINSGPKLWAVNCGDNAGSILYGSVTMPDSYSGGTIAFLLVAENENATPSGALNFDFSAMCRSDSDVINSTWGTAVELALSLDTQYDVEQFWSSAVTPNGTCAAGDTLFWRAVMDATNTTTQVADTYILGVKMEYPTNDWSD